MRNSASSYGCGKATGRSYLSISLSLLIVIFLLSSGNAQSTQQVRKRVLGIGFASPESRTSISNDDIDLPTSRTNDDTDAPIFSDGRVIDEATVTPTVTESAATSFKAKATKSPGTKASKAPATKSPGAKESKAPTTKASGAKKSKAPTTLKLTKAPSKIDGGGRKLGTESNDSELVPIVFDGMVQDGATTNKPTTISKEMKSVKAKTTKSPTLKSTKGTTKLNESTSSKNQATKASTEVDNEGRLDYGAIEFGATDEPTSSSTSPSSFFSSSLSSTGLPTGSPTKSLTDSPTRSPTDSPTKSPTSSPTKSPKTESPTGSPTQSPTKSPKTKSPTGSPNQSPTGVPTLVPVKVSKKTKAPGLTEALRLVDFASARNQVVPTPEAATKKSKTEETKKSKATKAPAVI